MSKLPEFAFPLGSLVKDKVSGIEGILTAAEQRIGFGLQYSVQPKSDGVTMPDAWNIDPFALELISEGVSTNLPPMGVPLYDLRQTGMDMVTGVKGTIISICYSMNGCISVTMAFVNYDGDILSTHFSQERFLGDSLNKVAEAEPARTGALSNRVIRHKD